MLVHISKRLPKRILDELKGADGVVTSEGSPPLVDIRESPAGMEAFGLFLAESNAATDPILRPKFGGPVPYLSAGAESEVFNILESYHDLTAADIAAGDVPYRLARRRDLDGYSFQFRGGNVVVRAALQEIASVTHFAAVCPELSALPPGQIVCDLVIAFANVLLVTRVLKV